MKVNYEKGFYVTTNDIYELADDALLLLLVNNPPPSSLATYKASYMANDDRT